MSECYYLSAWPISLGESGFEIEHHSNWPQITSFPVKLWECDLGHIVNQRRGIRNQVFMSSRPLLSARSYCYPRKKRKEKPSIPPAGTSKLEKKITKIKVQQQ